MRAKSTIVRVGLAMACLTAASFGSTVNYTETTSVANGCTDPTSGQAITMIAGNCTVNVNSVTNPEVETWGMTQFTTTGGQMAGLNVTVTFSDGFTDSMTWVATNTTSGGVTNSTAGVHDWSLTQTGDTFPGQPGPPASGPFILTDGNTVGNVNITSISIQGLGQSNSNCPAGTNTSILCGTTFDRTSPGGDSVADEQTPGSHRGSDFNITGASNATANYNVTVTYSDEFGLTSTNACTIANTTGTIERTSGPCADEWTKITLQFNSSGTAFERGASLDFTQDTDTTLSGPEPSTFFLGGLGMLVTAGCVLRRNRARLALAARRVVG